MPTVSIIKGTDYSNMLIDTINLNGGLSVLLPNEDEAILIKPNFGCHKTAITGATTDLRVLAKFIEILQNNGYSNVVVGDGGMAGYLKIDILKYLGVRSLCRKFGVKVIDLNQDNGISVILSNGAKVKVSETVLNSRVINLAKLKTHVITSVSLGIKNLMGCIVGIDKREVHLHGLHEGLASLVQVIKPCFTIIEGLIGMEGRGPVAGQAVKSDVIIASKDLIAADITASKIMGFDPMKIFHLKFALENLNYEFNPNDIVTLGHSLANAMHNFKKPIPKKLETNHYIDILKHTIRGTPLQSLAYSALSSNIISKIIKDLGILQEETDHDLSEQLPIIDNDKCKGCGLCSNTCPVNGISLINGKAKIEPDKCIKCFCCVEICPYGLITLDISNNVHSEN